MYFLKIFTGLSKILVVCSDWERQGPWAVWYIQFCNSVYMPHTQIKRPIKYFSFYKVYTEMAHWMLWWWGCNGPSSFPLSWSLGLRNSEIQILWQFHQFVEFHNSWFCWNHQCTKIQCTAKDIYNKWPLLANTKQRIFYFGGSN